MIGEIVIRNFKSLRNVDLRLKRISVFIGPNGSGKSSVAQALLVLKQSLGAERNVQLNGRYVSLGDFKEVLYSDAQQSRIMLGLGGLFDGAGFDYNILFDEVGLVDHEIEIRNDYRIRGKWSRESTGEQKPNPAQVTDRSDTTVKVDLECTRNICEPIKISGGSSGTGEDSRRTYNSLWSSVGSSLLSVRRMIERVFLVPGIRGIDEFRVELLERASADFATAEGASKQASHLASIAGFKPEILDRVSKWLRVLGEKESTVRHKLIEQSGPEQKLGVALEVVRPHATTNIMNEGLGLNQLVFPLVVLAQSPPDSLVAIEEPEIHLHPRFQSRLVDLLADISATEKKQLLLTTHSEHILFRLLTKIAKGELSKDDLAVYYFDRENLATKTIELQVTDGGRIKGSMLGFFEEELEQFREYIEAPGTKR